MIYANVLVMIFSVLFLISPAFGENEENLRKMETEALRKIVAANHLNESYGFCMFVRDSYFLGNNGLDKNVEALTKDSHAWVQNWLKILTLEKLADEQNVSSIEAAFQKLAANQGQKLQRLQKMAKEIDLQGKRALEILNTSIAPRDGIVPQYAEIPAKVKKMCQDLVDSIKTMQTLALTNVPRLEMTQKVSVRAFSNKLKKLIIDGGLTDLGEATKLAADLETFETQIRPYLLILERQENTVNELALEFRIFSAEQALSEGLEINAKAEEEIAGTLVTGRLKKPALQRIDDLKQAMIGHLKTLQDLGISKADMVYEFAKVERERLKEKCKSNESSVNCEKYAVLAAIKLNELKKMDPSRLELYERGWTELKEKDNRGEPL